MMRKLVMVAAASGLALLLGACGGKTEEAAPAEAPAEEMAPAEEAAPAEGTEAMSPEDAAAAEAAKGVDPNNNPIGIQTSSPNQQ